MEGEGEAAAVDASNEEGKEAEVERGSPFQIFPEEVWKLILEKLDDNKDIFNMFEVYPEMRDLLKSSRHLYLFDRVITHVAEFISEKSLLNCRMTCTKWRKGVDNMVENQPSLRAYYHDTNEPCQNWDPKDYSKVNNGKETEDPSLALFRRHFRWRYSFHNQLTIHRFVDQFSAHSRDRNPFIGRSVLINRYPWGDNRYITSFWNNAHNLLRQFGKHVWFIEIWEFIHQDPHHFAKSVLKSLHLLPNLRSLHLEGNLSWATASETAIVGPQLPIEGPMNISEFDFPPLPHLETLKIGDGYPELVDTIIMHYAPQVRRLVWSTRGWNWQEQYGTSFPNITEFVLVVRAIDRDRVNGLLLSLEAPQLYRLYLGFRGDAEITYKKDEIDEWMKRFPRLSVPHFRVVSRL